MKKIIILILLVVVIPCYYVFSDYLPPYTTLKLARLNSGLLIPRNAEIANLKKFSSHSGDEVLSMQINLNKLIIDKLLKGVQEKGYSKLPIKEFVPLPDQYGQFIFNYMDANTKNRYVINTKDTLTYLPEGYYRMEVQNDKKSFSISIIDIISKKIFIYKLKQ